LEHSVSVMKFLGRRLMSVSQETTPTNVLLNLM